MTGSDPNGKNLAAGIRLIHDEIRGLRGDLALVLKDAAEDRRRADADRERSDRRFEFLVETMREERKRTDAQFRALARSVFDVGRKILKKLDDHTTLLKSIKRGMNGRSNGAGGNGHPKP